MDLGIYKLDIKYIHRTDRAGFKAGALKEGLETRGYSVDTAPVGIEALNKVINSNYNLLITEVYFEDISGLGLHHIGKEKNSLLKTIAVNDRGDIMHNIASVFGIDKIVDVPIEPSVLCAEVDQLLEH